MESLLDKVEHGRGLAGNNATRYAGDSPRDGHVAKQVGCDSSMEGGSESAFGAPPADLQRRSVTNGPSWQWLGGREVRTAAT